MLDLMVKERVMRAFSMMIRFVLVLMAMGLGDLYQETGVRVFLVIAWILVAVAMIETISILFPKLCPWNWKKPTQAEE